MSAATEKALLDEVDEKLNQLVDERNGILKRYAAAVASESFGISTGDVVSGVDGYGDCVTFTVKEPYWFYLDARRMELWLLGENLKRLRASDAAKVLPSVEPQP